MMGTDKRHTLDEYVTLLSPVIASMHVETLRVTLLCKGFCPYDNSGHPTEACNCVKQIEDAVAADIMDAHAQRVTFLAAQSRVTTVRVSRRPVRTSKG